MPNARIPSLATWGLDVVPGYVCLPNGKEDLAWRERYFTWHRNVREWRVESIKRTHKDEEYRNLITKKGDRDTAFFVTHWLEVEEPRAVDTARGEIPIFDLDALDTLDDFADISDYETIHPFIPFAYQVQGMQIFDHVVLGTYRSQRLNIIWDKARGVGFTYAMLAAAYKTWLRRKGIRGTILAEKWDKADRTHSLNTLFGKLDLFFDSTPDHLIPPGFRSKDEKGAHRLKGTLFNPLTKSQINTEPTTVSSTRSGREAYVMIDEGAFQPWLDELWATALGTTWHIFGWSTASRQEGLQWQTKVDEAKKDTSGTVKLIEIDYWESPHQDEVWKRQTQAAFVAAGIGEQFEVEYLRNADAGSGLLVYKTLVDRCKVVPEWYDKHRPLYISVDPGIEDATAWVFWQTYFVDGKKRIRILDSYEMAKLPVEFHAHLITGIPPRAPAPATDFAGDAAWPLWAEGFYGEIEHYVMDWLREIPPSMIEVYGDPAVLTKDYSHESFAIKINEISEEIREAAGVEATGIFPMGASWKPLYKRNNFNERRQSGRKALMFTEFSDREGALLMKLALERTRFQEVTEKARNAPGHVHDRYSHRVQAWEFGMIWEMLELTDSELALPKVEKPSGLTHHGHRARSRYQKQTKSLMGVG